MQNTMSNALRLMTRRTRSGQSIIIIAMGFIVLIGFVGIATDAALLFVRYSTLRRAVDAAAVAAAGQIRENTSYAQVSAAAAQYIRLHGLDPESVKVETCETEIDDYKKNPRNGSPADSPPGRLQSWLSQNDATTGVPHSELCRPDPTKLVRVSAQISSPTTFLSVLGYGAIRLSASSLSQTAVMDIVLLLDGSLSMTADTRDAEVKIVTPRPDPSNPSVKANIYAQYDAFQGFAIGNPDPALGNFTLGLDPYDHTGDSTYVDAYNITRPLYTSDGSANGTHPFGSIRAECRMADPVDNWDGNGANGERAAYAYGGCCNDPTTQSVTNASHTNDYNWYIDSRTGFIYTPRQVPTAGDAHASLVSGKADGNYSDLVCRPFKDVRDAARRFLLKVDFPRGDRVIMIQFDAQSHPVTTAGYYDPSSPSYSGAIPLFTTRADAINSLNNYVGIEVNPGGKESSCAVLANSNTQDVPNGQRRAMPYDKQEFLYETIAPCPDTNTGGAIQSMTALLSDPRWIRRDAVWISVLLSDGYPNRTPGVGTLGGAPYGTGSTDTWNPNIHMIPNSLTGGSTYLSSDGNTYTYGGPTNNPNQRFFDAQIDNRLTDPGFCPWTTFCDPSANAGFPSLSYQLSRTQTGINDSTGIDVRPQNPNDGSANPDGYYNSFEWNAKYCSASEMRGQPLWWDFVKPGFDPVWHEGGIPIGARRPLCSDANPDTRHFCVDPNSPLQIKPGRLDLCSANYDADDFARDRVDFAALIDFTPKLKGNFISMFSIFFPHQSSDSTNSSRALTYLNDNILGVKFLRYMADAGDNGVIDNPLQRWYRDQAYGGTYTKDPMPPGASAFDDRSSGFKGSLLGGYQDRTDPCAIYDFRELNVFPNFTNQGNNPENLAYEQAARTSCGNYYYAGDPTAIDRAFTDIASRLFTRLAR